MGSDNIEGHDDMVIFLFWLAQIEMGTNTMNGKETNPVKWKGKKQKKEETGFVTNEFTRCVSFRFRQLAGSAEI